MLDRGNARGIEFAVAVAVGAAHVVACVKVRTEGRIL
jgi:hypothetical protein